MATPTIASVSPAIGLPSGDTLITLTGTNYRPPSHPAPGTVTDPDDVAPVTAIVLVDNVVATDVRVYSASMLTFLLPPGDPGDEKTYPAGRPVSITVSNVDQVSGLPIAGETVTLASAFSFIRPKHTSEYESDFTRLMRALLQLLKKQLIANVDYAVQTDFDPTAGDELHVAQFASFPALVLVGPDLSENRFYSRNDQSENDVPDGTVSVLDGTSPAGYYETRVPYTVDVLWEIIGASNTKTELLNLMANFINFMRKNKWLYLTRLANNPASGTIRYEFDFQPDGQPKTTTVPNNSNVRSWSAKVVIRGVDIESFTGLTIDGTSDPTNLVPAHETVDHLRAADTINVDATKLAK